MDTSFVILCINISVSLNAFNKRSPTFNVCRVSCVTMSNRQCQPIFVVIREYTIRATPTTWLWSSFRLDSKWRDHCKIKMTYRESQFNVYRSRFTIAGWLGLIYVDLEIRNSNGVIRLARGVVQLVNRALINWRLA